MQSHQRGVASPPGGVRQVTEGGGGPDDAREALLKQAAEVKAAEERA